MIVVVMGVTSVGKTTVGLLLAEALEAHYAEGDSYHPPANVEKMRQGGALDDADRAPWLEAIAADMRRWQAEGRSAVVTCSALKRSYRDVLRGAGPGVRFAWLTGDPAVIRGRMEGRQGHYMPVTLLPSQLATLESPTDEPDVVAVDVAGTPGEVAQAVLRALAVSRDAAS
ncbi:gluconokinase [Geminicoccaceae bacterium 1502E]|nr:gluconokinase [Geminicoccaceae bacterium 1502E]